MSMLAQVRPDEMHVAEITPATLDAPTAPAYTFRRPSIRKGTVAVLIPAHNEAEQITDTVVSLYSQTRQPDIILVISDNSTDDTILLARSAGAEVIQTKNNTFKKAGALNAGIRWLMQGEYFPELVVTIDGDTILEEHCIERALLVMDRDPNLGGLSVVCQGKKNLVRWPRWRSSKERVEAWIRRHPFWYDAQPRVVVTALLWLWAWTCAFGSSALMWAQRAEYVRAGFVRLRKNVHTLSGAGSVMRSIAILEILDERGHLYVEHAQNLVEDFEATLAIKRRWWTCTNNCYLVAYTDLMPNIRTLFRQRIRWVGGTINELRRRGWARETRVSILTLVYGYLGMPLFYVWVYLLAHHLHSGAGLKDLWFTACVGVYQAIGLRRLGVWSMLVGLLLVPECIYMLIRHTWLLVSLVYSYFGLLRKW